MTKPNRPSAADRTKEQFLVYLEPDLAKEVRIAAIEDNATQSSVTAVALREWLSRRGKHKSGSQAVEVG